MRLLSVKKKILFFLHLINVTLIYRVNLISNIFIGYVLSTYYYYKKRLKKIYCNTLKYLH